MLDNQDHDILELHAKQAENAKQFFKQIENRPEVKNIEWLKGKLENQKSRTQVYTNDYARGQADAYSFALYLLDRIKE